MMRSASREALPAFESKCITIIDMSDNKDHIVNLRVTSDTYEKLKKGALANSESVSNFIRKAIEGSIGLVADISEEILSLGSGDLSGIESYHPARAAKKMACARCGGNIVRGATMMVGETSGSRKYMLCEECGKKLEG